ncbi:MAG TPA: type II toxin-antitoxin system VapC family toxin [Aeromicrobium sp.]|nr:type II toxin-antitoxin system VapC family toxin [Aeromicrobium sp.]
MTGYLLDTNVVSETTKRTPNVGVLDWLRKSESSFMSVLTIGELRRGVLAQRLRNQSNADRFSAWLVQLEYEYRDFILDVDTAVIARWAEMASGRTLPVVNSLIAATAVTHDLTVVTRNTEDFTGLGVKTLNPFVEGAS